MWPRSRVIDASRAAIVPPNVRLQARAAGGASLCKPLFGGTCTFEAGGAALSALNFEFRAIVLIVH
jgi:hypothetical protein